ncbi:MAG: tripartite tricarboxylate transporter TctB family protein [Rubrivivax sp.]|nr:tripartite tricarboxylate transporter TctB family protein [Rubrivivax sp.]
MQRVDRWAGIALAVLALAVLWSARAFPAVPGQKLGAGFLPTLVGLGLLACGLGLVWRSRAPGAEPDRPAGEGARASVLPAFVAMGVVAVYVVAAERVGFLLLTPLLLVALFRALRVAWLPAWLWALGGTAVVHLAFYKLLRVPLPWGLLRPFY